MDGIEPVLLFSSDEVASVVPDNKRLRAFETVPLKVGEKRTVKFSIPASDLAFVNADGKWTLEAGDFKIQVGNLQLTVICNDSYQWETPNI